MIEITTLFLSLVFGSQLVELDVSPDVAAVEIRLDGESVSRLEGPPWKARIDLGEDLLAHRLEAIALDDAGHEIDRTVRYVNIGHQRQGGRMVLLEGDDGRPEAVGLGWESIGQREPVNVEVFFDGRPLDVETPERVPLPDYQPGDFHFVSAVFHFQDGGSRRMEMGFGGRLGLEVSSDLTTVSVLPNDGSRPPRLKLLEQAFRVRGETEPLAVHGIEKGGAELILVRDDDVQPVIDQLVRRIAGGAGVRLGARNSPGRSAFSNSADLLQSQALKQFAELPLNTRLRLLEPRASLLLPMGVSPSMFLTTEPLDGHAEGFLTHTLNQRPQQRPTQLGSAVALAGMMAQGTQRPRAVILLLGDGEPDASDITPEAARGYLRDLGVPLYVWAFEPVPVNSGWGEIQSLGPQDELGEAKRRFSRLTHELAEDLRRQRLVWLRGQYLPREIQLAPDVDELEIAGRAETEPHLPKDHSKR